jgi:cytochrome c oxidase subunit I
MAIGALVLGRRRGDTGILSWITTTNHKKIGTMYLFSAFFFFLIALCLALTMRTQTAIPDNTLVNPDGYREIFTTHALTMIFLVVTPGGLGFANYVVPLMIGARDMAFPRLNAFSFWILLFGGLVLEVSFLFGAAPNNGWFAYAPITENMYSPGVNQDTWTVAIQILGLSSLATAVNFLVTILRLRAPGMKLTRMPMFVWAILVDVVMILLAFPALTSVTALLMLDRYVGTTWFFGSGGGSAVLWQHLFWYFGHPEVYIMAVPAFGIISEVIAVFSRKPLFGYMTMAWSLILIGFLSMVVWAHHMFTVSLSLEGQAAFVITSSIIAVPTGIKIFNWIATMWGGRLVLKSALLFAVGFIANFLIGGLTGVALAMSAFDWQVTGTYYVVAHFHYVLLGGVGFALFAAVFYWFPKIMGRLLDERLGRIQFILFMIGFNVTFFPVYFLGLYGQPRRMATYAADTGWGPLSFLSAIGAFILAASVVIFTYNLIKTLRHGELAGGDPWNAWTLEWATSSPPPHYNFAILPEIKSSRPLWDVKHPEAPHKQPRARFGAHPESPGEGGPGGNKR